MAHMIDATETQGYVARDSEGPAALLAYEGNFDLIVKSARRNEKLSEAKNTTVSLILVVQDNDFEGAQGSVVYHSFPVTGKVSVGQNAGRHHVSTLIDLCLSAGRSDLADMIIGKTFDIDALLESLVGDGKSTHAYARLVVQEDMNGRERSVPAFYLGKGKAKYDESKQTGGSSFRSKPRVRTARAGVSAPNGTAQRMSGVAVDAIASEV
jgi:hypothetical protein